MYIRRLLRSLTPFERGLWITSLLVTTGSFVVSGDILTYLSSLIGVTSLIFIAKGHVAGQFLSVIFSVFYGIISFWFRYYGEVITFLGMNAPIAVMTIVSWLRHPYKDSDEVAVSRVSRRQLWIITALTIAVTAAFYFILDALGTTNLAVSTISVATSFSAAALMFLRSPYYALAYASNDVVLIVLWTLAVFTDLSYLPMVFCFVMFLANDLYAFYNWRRMQKRQAEH